MKWEANVVISFESLKGGLKNMNTLKTTMFIAAITVLFVLIGQTLGGQGGMRDGACLCPGAS